MPSFSNDLIQLPSLTILLCISIISSLVLVFARFHGRAPTAPYAPSHNPPVNTQPTGYPPVEQLSDFDWKTKEPLKLRPFKPKYNLTMSIQDATVNELIEMDKNYLDRVTLREKLMEQHPDQVSGAEYSAKAAVDEFYIWLVGTYLPTRFPTMFQLQSQKEIPHLLHCRITGKDYSLKPDMNPVVTLRTMGGLVDDDLLFLLPSEDGDGYKLKAFVTCFPNGFNTADKLNLKLRDIHKPVPGYKEKLETSMDRYLGRLKVGKFIKRANWTITTTNKLFTATGNHLYEGEAVRKEEIDIETVSVVTAPKLQTTELTHPLQGSSAM
ncbi:hypothetical protein MYU51_001283 [Penicillium brevicompactum]|uniref:uncharacterized protein n=1 Tax=Penicillium brevicompactum TaxID=5074 RepID=UPI00253F8CE3|nr:uncharacterized protein N7506_008868 [Penicillium brevicompactum]KAJ5325766.1 hypothetical protein N7506_008868 [Penicillium brevicompactum]